MRLRALRATLLLLVVAGPTRAQIPAEAPASAASAASAAAASSASAELAASAASAAAPAASAPSAAAPASAPVAPAGNAAPASSAAPGSLQPFVAHYVAQWQGINVGESVLELVRNSVPDHYVYKWTITAHGIFHLLYSQDVIQQSWFSIVDGRHVRPERYRGEEGDSSVSFTFDWPVGHAFGSSEGKPIDITLKPGSQDLLSIQIEVMLDLKNGDLPDTFYIVDKDQLKDFNYAREGSQRLRTEIGTIDTLVVSSRRAGNDRVLRLWFAPSLGYVPVQAERTRKGKVEFAMRIKSLTR